MNTAEVNCVDLPAETATSQLSDREFTLFQTLIHNEAGIYLSEGNKPLLVCRLARRLRALGLKSFREYYNGIVDDRFEDERVRLFDSICTNLTHFFRGPH